MTSCWDILGIAEGSSQVEVKKAYARILKTSDVQNSPEEFQKLRESFEIALQLTKSGPSREEEFSSSLPKETTTYFEDNSLKQPESPEEGREHFTYIEKKLTSFAADPLPEWWDRLEEPENSKNITLDFQYLFSSPFDDGEQSEIDRQKLAEHLIQLKAEFGLQAKLDLSVLFFAQVLEANRANIFIPLKTLQLLQKFFNWDDRQSDLIYGLSKDDIDFFFYRLSINSQLQLVRKRFFHRPRRVVHSLMRFTLYPILGIGLILFLFGFIATMHELLGFR